MHKRLLRILLLALIAVMLTGFYDDYPIDENVLPITDLSIPNKLYWLERLPWIRKRIERSA